VRASDAPFGNTAAMITLPWSCAGMNPTGVATIRQPVSARTPA
jgi:hypothetical protein